MKKGVKNPNTMALSRVPLDISKSMLDFTKLRDTVMGMGRGKKRARAIAMLHIHYPTHQLAEILGVKESFVRYCSYRNKDIAEAASISRNMMISDMTEHRVVELLQKMNVDNIDDHRKPQAVKYLMDSMEIAKQHTKKPEEIANESVSELIFRVRKRMIVPKEDEGEIIEAIDVTGEIEDAK